MEEHHVYQWIICLKYNNMKIGILNNHATVLSRNGKSLLKKKVYVQNTSIWENLQLCSTKEEGGTGKLKRYWEIKVYAVPEKKSRLTDFM